MPYLVAKGTRARVVTPNGRIIDPYTCRQDTTFTDTQARGYGLHLQFERDGFKLIVPRNSAIPISLSCAGCGTAIAAPSLCPRCESLHREPTSRTALGA